MTGYVTRAIDKAIEEREHAKPPRGHLGASQIGHPCARAVWYGFRWAHIVHHTGRLLRLFDRGHREEASIIANLRAAGVEVQDHSARLCYHDGSDSYVLRAWEEEYSAELDDVSDDPMHVARATSRNEGPAQWEFKDGHFSGSGDGKIVGGLPQCTRGPGLLECKTSNEKRFKVLATKKLIQANPTHYVQMQVYMRFFHLVWGLYFSVCKNDDSIHEEVVAFKPEVADHYVTRAHGIIALRTAPPRIHDSASWWQCRMCDHRAVCHEGAPADKNCRSCTYAVPGEGRTWFCGKWEREIPLSFQVQGCDHWEDITA